MVVLLFVPSGQLCFVLFFFFQAEDGIRDLTVTGVQTCALPISRGQAKGTSSEVNTRHIKLDMSLHNTFLTSQLALVPTESINASSPWYDVKEEIGRASCRERV